MFLLCSAIENVFLRETNSMPWTVYGCLGQLGPWQLEKIRLDNWLVCTIFRNYLSNNRTIYYKGLDGDVRKSMDVVVKGEGVMVKRLDAQLLVRCQNGLGEGVVWNVQRQRLYWTDILGSCLYSCDEFGQDVTKLALEENLASYAFTKGDRWLAAFSQGLYWLCPDTGARELISKFEADKPYTRMNDGMVDRYGRFVVGGFDNAGLDVIRPVTSLIRVEREETELLIAPIGCANSLSFSPDGQIMYFADTKDKDIFTFDYAGGVFDQESKKVLATLGADEGIPDGSTMDADGALWNAQYGGGGVQRFLPDGTKDIRIDLPVKHVTCCAFGGAGLDKLFITTANCDLSEAEKKSQPAAGGLFVIEPGPKGLPAEIYGAGSLSQHSPNH